MPKDTLNPPKLVFNCEWADTDMVTAMDKHERLRISSASNIDPDRRPPGAPPFTFAGNAPARPGSGAEFPYERPGNFAASTGPHHPSMYTSSAPLTPPSFGPPVTRKDCPHAQGYPRSP